MKKLSILLAILLVSILVITGCTAPAATTPATSPTPTKPAATTPAATSPAATSPAATKPAATTPAATSPAASSPAATSTGTKITWEQALTPEYRNKTVTVTGKVNEVVPGWTTHLLIVMGAPYGTGFEAEIFDPTIWPDPTFQSWVGKDIEVTGKIIVSDKASSLGATRLYILETSQVKVLP